MAVNPPSIGLASQAGPASQIPGNTTPSVGFGQSASQPISGSIDNQGQSSTPGIGSEIGPGFLDNLPTIQTYASSVPYLAALEQQPQLTTQALRLSDPALASIQRKLLAQQQSNPLLNGTQPPHPASTLAKQQSPMNPLQLIGAAGQDLWNQEIVQPVSDYISTWQHDPKTALLETLGGVAVTAGLVGLEAVTGGAATPFIFAGLAAMQAPNLISAYSQEILHPSDANLVRAMVSTGAAALAVGSPIRAFRGIKTARNILEYQIEARKTISAVKDASDLLLGQRMAGAGVPGMRTSMQLMLRHGTQLIDFETLDVNNVEGLRAQLEKRNANLEKGPAADLLGHVEVIDKLRQEIVAARSEGDVQSAAEAMGELKQYVAENLRDSFLSTAYEYVFLPQSAFSHVPIRAIEGVDAGVQDALHEGTQKIYGLLRRMHSGIGLQSPSDMAQQGIASIKEAEAYDRAAGTSWDSTNRILTELHQMKEAAGVLGGKAPELTEAEWTRYVAQLESPLQEGSTRLYRAELSPEHRGGLPDWVKEAQDEEGISAAKDRWFTADSEHLDFYRADIPDFEKKGRVTYVDVPTSELEQYRASNLPEGKFSAQDMAEHEFFVAPEMSKGRRAIQDLHGNKYMPKDLEEFINQALEEPEKWKMLKPNQQAYAQKLRDIFDMMTSGDLKYGTLSQPLQGTGPRFFTGVAATKGEAQETLEEAAKRVYTTSWLTHPNGARAEFWKAAVDDETGAIQYGFKTRQQIVRDIEESAKLHAETKEHRQILDSNEQQIRKWRRSIGQLRRYKNDNKIAALEDQVKRTLGDAAHELVTMSNDEITKIQKASPKAEELVTGGESIKRALTNHVFRVQRAAYGEALQAHANLNVVRLRSMFKKLNMESWGAAMAEHPQFKNTSNMPDVLPETVFEGAGNAEEAAKKLGYFVIHPATGFKGELNYRPALYGRGALANEISAAGEKLTSAEQQSGVINALYKIVSQSKRYIMYNPVYHFLNVAGRALAFLGSDPAAVGTAIKGLRGLMSDPAAYMDLMQEAASSGLVHATQWNVAEHLRILQKEEDGQHSFFGAIRTPIGTLSNIHRETAERGLWAAVDQLQLAGYLYSKQRFLDKGIGEFEARRLAATYANNLGGMVNPLYMSRLWKHMKGLIFFAPSYWSTFLHALQSVMPGSARLSGVLTERGGGRFAGLAAVPLRAIDHRARIELTRAQRDWMITYLATTAVSMDMLNVMFSGHHLWENEQGHEWNIDVTRLPGVGGTQASPSGEVKRAYITASPLFRQGVDLGQAIGLGHDYGFAHTFGDQSWQKQDALHKAEMSAGALIDGLRRVGSTKLGALPTASTNFITGQDVTSWLGSGTQVKIDRPFALASLAPDGYQLERMWKTYRQAVSLYKPGTPEYQQALQQFQQSLPSVPQLMVNAIGFPSVYHMGVERPPIDDSKFDNWVTQRDSSHQRLTQYSNEIFQGRMTPLEYARHKHEEQIRINQLNLDTWGANSPGASLSGEYQSLATQYHLDDPSLSNQDWFEYYDQFLTAWNQLLQSASPATRAAWWDHSRMQWTDADYLEWEAKQLKDSLAASIDHQNGRYIRAVQNQLFRLKPTLTIQQYTQLEQSDPIYYTYTTLLKEMGKTSALGAFVSAFSSPYSQTYIPPEGLTPQQVSTLGRATGQVVVRPEKAKQLAQQARQVAQEPEVREAGGQPEASPEFQQIEQQAIGAARSGNPVTG